MSRSRHQENARADLEDYPVESSSFSDEHLADVKYSITHVPKGEPLGIGRRDKDGTGLPPVLVPSIVRNRVDTSSAIA
ncbi:hypothetical protein ACFSSA_07855 [Luteolibacter algae]|uniref:Uncharacterized protein n=1 Tax=Luteolibacter algae TaxID=454151 RepID=A0ABW5DAY7_9BACT